MTVGSLGATVAFLLGQVRRFATRAAPRLLSLLASPRFWLLIVRSILLLTLILLAVGAAAAVVEPTRKSEPSQPSFALKWVRTADGWERPSTWRPSPRIKPELHPSVVAGFLLLSSLACLFAGPPSRS